jgi:hypothetical protein
MLKYQDLFVDDVQQVNIIVQNALNCLDKVVVMNVLNQLMVVELLIAVYYQMIYLMTHIHLHLSLYQFLDYLNVLNIFQPKE